MRKLLLSVLLALTVGCASPSAKEAPIKPPTQVTIQISEEISDFIKWMNAEFPKIQKQLKITSSPKVVFYTGLGETRESENRFYNILGLYTYSNKTIHIFWRFTYRNTLLEISLPLEQLKYTFYHEVLHWYDHITGAPSAPIDHNEIFDKRLRALGWVT